MSCHCEVLSSCLLLSKLYSLMQEISNSLLGGGRATLRKRTHQFISPPHGALQQHSHYFFRACRPSRLRLIFCFRCSEALLPPDANTVGLSCGSVMAVHRGPSTKWLFTRDQLENTPSRRCGIEADRELSYRQQAANLIQDIGQRLNVYPL